MFKREIHVEMKKPSKTPPPPQYYIAPQPKTDPMLINAMVRMNVRDAAILVGAGFALKKLVDTASEVALLVAKNNIK